jgi:hypothetical protein
MGRKLQVWNSSSASAADIAERGRPGAPKITTKHELLTGSWTADVDALEAAIGRFKTRRPLKNDCRVVFFEIVRDERLHVNVTHRHQTAAVRGWAGPASLPDGFVHNRTFDDASPARIVRHIRDVVFAARI